MKIRKLHLKNIGVFDDEEIVFQPCKVKDKAEIHIFTGQNGSGKSTILMALIDCFDFGAPREPERVKNRFEKRFTNFESSKAIISFDEGEDVTILRQLPSQVTKNAKILEYKKLLATNLSPSIYLDFAVFAYSGNRRLKSEYVEALKEYQENILFNSLDFEKYESPNKFTVNQLLANNISKSGIEYRRGNVSKSEKFAKTVFTIEQVISEITGWTVQFDLETEPTNLIVKVNSEKLDFDVLPDGLQSLISWIADLLGRVDLLKWQDNLPINEKNLILFLDEIEVHLHPAWQRKVLPVVQKLFKNSQIFISTHSPFVINSVDDAWVYKLELENGKARVADVVLSEDGLSYQTVLREIFGIDKRFGDEAQNKLDDFYRQRDFILKANGKGKIKKKDFLKLAKDLASQSAELQSLVFLELARLSKETGEPYEI